MIHYFVDDVKLSTFKNRQYRVQLPVSLERTITFIHIANKKVCENVI